ncbi:MAG TPA: hypothetical protein DCX95_07925, partial [Elusimicrobia bacterium]|nr:hypothetical protein [Elusimicrobiota bacterium]
MKIIKSGSRKWEVGSGLRTLLLTTYYLLLTTSCFSAVHLTVETGEADAKVAALNFDAMHNPSPNSVFKPADATGKAVLEIAADTDYVVFANKQGRFPTLRDQVMMGKAIPVRTASDMTVYFSLTETLPYDVGIIYIGLVNISTGAPVVGDIRNVTTNEQVSFIMEFLTDTLTAANTNYVLALNIPAAPENTYIVNIFSPKDKEGMSKPVTDPLIAGGTVTVHFDFDTQEAMAVQTQDTGIT